MRCRMLIRSQDKKSITTDLNLEIFENETKNEYVIGNITRGRLGTYYTEEKAIKVLDMICEKYMKNQALYIDRENNARVIPQNSVFQMPLDEDVEV